MLFQIFILNHQPINDTVTFFNVPSFIPLLFPELILLLPIRANFYVMMFYALVIGFVLDIFGNTPGMHAASLVLLAYLRPRILRLFFQQDEKKLGWARPTMYRLGLIPFLFYISISILVHHLFYFILQEWNIRLILMMWLIHTSFGDTASMDKRILKKWCAKIAKPLRCLPESR